MPRRNFSISDLPIQHKNQPLKMTKSYTDQDFTKHTVLTNDIFTYVSFYFDTHIKSMKYKDSDQKHKYGNPNQYNYKFYWKQSEIFYKSYRTIDKEASPVAAYYCILNAVKAYIAYSSDYVDDFVDQFGMHGILEAHEEIDSGLGTIKIKHKSKGVFPLFAKILDDNFDDIWGTSRSIDLKTLFYNMAFIHRAYTMTYSSKRKTVNELFLPLNPGSVPMYHKGTDGKAHLVIKLDKRYFAANAIKIPNDIQTSLYEEFKPYETNQFILYSTTGQKINNGSISTELKTNNKIFRKQFLYIKSNKRLWYLKRSNLNQPDVINLSEMTLIMAAMHRISEIARYKPEQLNRLLLSKENWLLHEFISLALDQFIDEIACEITDQEIMSTGEKT